MFWAGLELFEKIMFVLACTASGILIIQIIMLLVGIDDLDGEMDIDSGGAGFFTLKGVIAFFALGGWVAFGVSTAGVAWWWSALAGVAAGLAAFFAIGFIFRLAIKLQSSGTLNMKNGIGQSAEVYLTIPGGPNGAGKITFLLQGRLIEADAICKADEPILTGEFVKITDYTGDKYVVEKIKETE